MIRRIFGVLAMLSGVFMLVALVVQEFRSTANFSGDLWRFVRFCQPLISLGVGWDWLFRPRVVSMKKDTGE